MKTQCLLAMLFCILEEMNPENESLPKSVVMHLVSPYLNAGWNVMADNYFSSLPLAKKLEKKKTNFVGTIRRHLKEIPLELKNSKTELYESVLQ